MEWANPVALISAITAIGASHSANGVNGVVIRGYFVLGCVEQRWGWTGKVLCATLWYMGRTQKTASRSQTGIIRNIRHTLGRTQGELALALGVSEKCVQSYEQGWRSTPVRVTIQLLVLLALYRKQYMGDILCWEIKRCQPEARKKCAAFTVGRGQFCWFIGAKARSSKCGDSGAGISSCMRCEVVKRLLQGPGSSSEQRR
jgi:DNA-binding XRE family transcriptional regulator